MRAIIPGEPDFIDAVVEADHAVVWQCFADFFDDMLWIAWEAPVVRPFKDVGVVMFANSHHAGKVPVRFGAILSAIFYFPNRVSDVSNHLNLRKVDGVNLCGVV